MKISGFTIVRNAVINDYPVVESIRSALPMVDEMVVALGDSDDETEALVRSIISDKIRIIHSCWNPALKKGGEILAVETDKALMHISPDSDWAFYIQADEVLHEKYYKTLQFFAMKYVADPETEGFLFNFVHFYGSYEYVANSRKWYNKEVRLIRNGIGIQAYRDAQGFRKNGLKLKVRQVPATMFHYGWVKSPFKMKEKLKHTHAFWEDSDTEKQRRAVQQGEIFDFSTFDSLELFTETHPLSMRRRIDRYAHFLDLDIGQKHFSLKGHLLFFFEKWTGHRPFEYRNYKVL